MKVSIQSIIQVYCQNKTADNLERLKKILSSDLDPTGYAELAIRTEGSVDPVSKRLQRIKTARLLHACMGMCTGVAELYQNIAKASIDTVNFRQELGDSIWYAAVISKILDVPLNTLLSDVSTLKINECRLYLSESTILDLTARLNQASIAVGEIQDAVRRHVFYGKLLDFTRVTENLGVYVQCIQQIGAELGIEFKDMAATNLTKLIVLFGDKFLEDYVSPHAGD